MQDLNSFSTNISLPTLTLTLILTLALTLTLTLALTLTLGYLHDQVGGVGDVRVRGA